MQEEKKKEGQGTAHTKREGKETTPSDTFTLHLSAACGAGSIIPDKRCLGSVLGEQICII